MYAHIDCNNFFASCERLFRPELEGKPVAVLSNNDGCIIARSAEVKALGVTMGIPVFQVQSIVKAQGITLFSANFELYGDISERIVTILREVTPLIEVYSIDESFLDLSELDITNLSTWAKNVQEQIGKEVGMPVSIGIGPTKTLAKVATTYAKKHGGIAVINNDDIRQKVLEGLPVEDVWGIGWRTAPKLRERGVTNAWQLVSATDAWLKQHFNISGMRMVDELRGTSCLAFGDKREKRQSIMVSRAFGHKVRAYHQLESATASFATRATAKLRSQGSVCSRVVVYLSTSRHDERVRSVSKSIRLGEATADTGRIITTALGLLDDLYDPEFSYQKVMIMLLDIVDREAWQLSLTDPARERDERERLMAGVDALNARYGMGTVWHAVEDKSRAHWQSKHALRSPRYTTNWAELPAVKA
jgi:DNA polymerase V